METKKTTRSSAASRTSSSTPAPAPAPNRAAQARVARGAEGTRQSPPALAPTRDTPQVTPPAVPPVGGSPVSEDSGNSASVGGLLDGLNASFHPEGAWGQGYIGIQAQREGSRINAQTQFSLDTPNVQANGAGEGTAGIGRGGVFAEGNVNGVATTDGKDTSFDASGQLGVKLGSQFDFGRERTQNEDGSTTVGGRLVIPTPFGFSVGGGWRVRYDTSE